MFDAKDFEVPLEKQLKMRLVYDDIDKCDSVDALRENLKECATQLMKYQHLLTKVLEKQLTAELEKWSIEVTKIVKERNESADA